jgi:2-C-methyl-D-erythritol 4-phosphate cytidylyltransferase
MSALAILVAAGKGERMGADRPKAFLRLAGQSLLLRSALAFEASEHVGHLVVVVPSGEEGAARSELSGLTKLLSVVAGGGRRQDSVRAGLRQAPRGFDGVVLVHDAARPFVDAELIASVIRSAAAVGGAVPVVPVVDTLKRLRDGRVVEPIDRSELGSAQTPQGFRLSVLARAYDAAFDAGLTVTDEAMAVERAGGAVAAVRGSVRNRKITTPEDLVWAEGELGRDA